MSAMGVAAEVSLPARARVRLDPRIRGIDLARAIAIVGMVMVHRGPIRSPGGGILGELYRLPHGRASILFVVVAGIGASLLASAPLSGGMKATTVRLGWRVLILFPLGLALQELGTGVAVILQYYALYFVIASVAVCLSDRVLLGLVGAMSIAGPLAVLVARRSQPEWFGPIPEWSALGDVARDLVISGTYPAVVWVVPLLIGIWVGRQDLRSSAVAARLMSGGAAVAAGAFGMRYWIEGVAGTAGSRTEWLQLAAIKPHNEMPLWVLSATGIAVAIVGGAVLIASAAPRLLWPLVTMGQLAFSVYVTHLLILWWRPAWLDREEFAAAWIVVGVFALVTLVLTSVWRAFAPRGPVETLLHLPWWWLERRRQQRLTAQRLAPGELPQPAASSS